MKISEIKFSSEYSPFDSPPKIKDIAIIKFTSKLNNGGLNGEITIDKDTYFKNACNIEVYLSNLIAKELL